MKRVLMRVKQAPDDYVPPVWDYFECEDTTLDDIRKVYP